MIVYLMLSLEDSDMDQDHVSSLQVYCPAAFIIILLVAPCLLLLELVSLPVGSSDMFP